MTRLKHEKFIWKCKKQEAATNKMLQINVKFMIQINVKFIYLWDFEAMNLEIGILIVLFYSCLNRINSKHYAKCGLNSCLN